MFYKTGQDVFDCLIDSFKTTGGVPREILFDNMSSIVDRDGNKRNVPNQVRALLPYEGELETEEERIAKPQ